MQRGGTGMNMGARKSPSQVAMKGMCGINTAIVNGINTAYRTKKIHAEIDGRPSCYSVYPII